MIVHTISQTKTFDVQQLEKIRKPAKQNVLVQYDNSTMHQESLSVTKPSKICL